MLMCYNAPSSAGTKETRLYAFMNRLRLLRRIVCNLLGLVRPLVQHIANLLDCLLEQLLRDIQSGAVECLAVDTPVPSQFSTAGKLLAIVDKTR